MYQCFIRLHTTCIFLKSSVIFVKDSLFHQRPIYFTSKVCDMKRWNNYAWSTHHIFVLQNAVAVLDWCKTSPLMCVLFIPSLIISWSILKLVVRSMSEPTNLCGCNSGNMWVSYSLDCLQHMTHMGIQTQNRSRMVLYQPPTEYLYARLILSYNRDITQIWVSSLL